MDQNNIIIVDGVDLRNVKEEFTIASYNGNDFIQISALSELILDHLVFIQDTFEKNMGLDSSKGSNLEVDMFHAINDLVSSFHKVVEGGGVDNIGGYRKQLLYTWRKYASFNPFQYENENVSHKEEVDDKNKSVLRSLLEEFEKPFYRNRWSMSLALIKELKYYHHYHANQTNAIDIPTI